MTVNERLTAALAELAVGHWDELPDDSWLREELPDPPTAEQLAEYARTVSEVTVRNEPVIVAPVEKFTPPNRVNKLDQTNPATYSVIAGAVASVLIAALTLIGVELADVDRSGIQEAAITVAAIIGMLVTRISAAKHTTPNVVLDQLVEYRRAEDQNG